MSNLHYSFREGSEPTNVFSKEPIICKLGDLIKARSTITKIIMTVCNFGARFVNRCSAALLVLEIQIETQLKDSAGVNDIKRLTYEL